MLIEKLEVKNFRALREVTLNCSRLTAILGRNGAGKSSLLTAIDLFYNTASTVTTEDFYDRDTNNPIEIRVTYSGLTDEERQEFGGYLLNDKLSVLKRIDSSGSGRYYASAMQVLEFAELRSKGKRDRISGLKDLIQTDERFSGLDASFRSADEADQLMEQFERDNTHLTQPVEREEQFFGPPNIGGGKLDKYTRFVLVPAVREAAEEADRKGTITQLIDMLVLRRINAREDIQNLQRRIEEGIAEVYSNENLTELGDLGRDVSVLLGRYAPGAGFELTFSEPEPPKISLPAAIARLVEHGFRCPISHAGHGLQRCLILTLLQHLAMVTEVPEEPSGGAEDASPPALPDPDLIVAIEEPELYLHPSRCRYLSSLLLQLTHGAGDTESGRNQIIYATHSPYFVDLERFDDVRIARRVRDEGDRPAYCEIRQFSKSEASRELARIAGGDPANFTADSFQARASNVMTTMVNEGFFADKVMVVEGASELGVLLKIQEIKQADWPSRDIVIVPAGGKTNIDRPVIVFRGLGIPTYFVFDADGHKAGRKLEEEKPRNRHLLRLARVPEEDFPESGAFECYAVFASDLEHEIRSAIGEDAFLAARAAVADKFGYEESAVMKNADCTSRLVEIIYETGGVVPLLDRIIQKVADLV